MYNYYIDLEFKPCTRFGVAIDKFENNLFLPISSVCGFKLIEGKEITWLLSTPSSLAYHPGKKTFDGVREKLHGYSLEAEIQEGGKDGEHSL